MQTCFCLLLHISLPSLQNIEERGGDEFLSLLILFIQYTQGHTEKKKYDIGQKSGRLIYLAHVLLLVN